MYHSVGKVCNKEEGELIYCISEENFKKQLEIINIFNKRQSDSSNKVVITFDDGDETNYSIAYPLLKKYGLNAAFFIIGSRVGTPGYMDWVQIKKLQFDGMIIGSHGMTHRILPLLDDRDLFYELGESKRLLESRIGCVVEYFSIPRGFCNKRILTFAKKIGYKKVFTSDLVGNSFEYGRIAIKRDWDSKIFLGILKGKIPFWYFINSAIKKHVIWVLGVSNYDRLRTKVLGLW